MSKVSKQSVLDLMQRYDFNAMEEALKIIKWIQDYFAKIPNAPVLVGMSGGKDSLIVAALCVAALGPERVIGVMMPNGWQKDQTDAIAAIKYLEIKHIEYNIEDVINAQITTLKNLGYKDFENLNNVVMFNNPARIRMCTLYLIANQIGGRVTNTCNMSETYVGYDTRWGDQCGDFSPIKNYTVSEVRLIGEYLELPKELVYKAPDDGMCGVTDEERYGFTYEELDYYLRGGVVEDKLRDTIEEMHAKAAWKNDAIYLPGPDYFPKLH